MNHCADFDLDQFDLDQPDNGAEYCQHLFGLAHARLILLPTRADGCKVANVASYGPYVIQLMEVGFSGAITIPTLWVELHDTLTGRTLNSAGCWDLQEASDMAEQFIAEARRLSGFDD